MKIRKHLGQNFLYDKNILKKIIESSGITKDDTVVEIGAGTGVLTKMLALYAYKVIAIEADELLHKRLKEETIGVGNIEIVYMDALIYPYQNLNRFKVVSNIPYYITTPIIFKLLENRQNIDSITLTVQKEVAQRIVAIPNKKAYSVLSLSVQYYAQAEIKFIVPASVFRPIPKVDSAVIYIKPFEEHKVRVLNEKIFFRIIKQSFSKRRKTLANSLKSVSINIKPLLLEAGIDPMRRAETLTMKEFAKLSDIISQSS